MYCCTIVQVTVVLLRNAFFANFDSLPVMLTRPQPYETEAKTKTPEAEAKIFGLEAEFEAKFMRRQRLEKPNKIQWFISKN